MKRIAVMLAVLCLAGCSEDKPEEVTVKIEMDEQSKKMFEGMGKFAKSLQARADWKKKYNQTPEQMSELYDLYVNSLPEDRRSSFDATSDGFWKFILPLDGPEAVKAAIKK